MAKHDDRFDVPEKVQRAAREGLALHEEHKRGGTDAGLAMARKLAGGGPLTAEEVRHVAHYFPRHAGDNLAEDGKKDHELSNGYIAWQLWGGDAGREWSEDARDRLEREED